MRPSSISDIFWSWVWSITETVILNWKPILCLYVSYIFASAISSTALRWFMVGAAFSINVYIFYQLFEAAERRVKERMWAYWRVTKKFDGKTYWTGLLCMPPNSDEVVVHQTKGQYK